MIKFKIFVDMDKEETYLRSMAKAGYMLKSYNSLGFYTFEPGKPQELHYKIDYRVFKNKRAFQQYRQLFQDSGWIHVCGSSYSGGQYFLPSNNNSYSAEIFSDLESKAARFKRLSNQCMFAFIITLCYLAAFFSMNGFNFSKLGYLTPGLWEKTGSAFWFAFLFESPFVIFRFLPPILIFSLTVIYAYWAYKARELYNQKKPAG